MRIIGGLILIILAQLSVDADPTTNAEKYKIVVIRRAASTNGIAGELSIGAKSWCALEFPFANEKFVGRIPTGTYPAFLRTNHPVWKIELVGAPRRSGPQIYMRNYSSNLTECILVGTDLNGSCVIGGSPDAMAGVLSELRGAGRSATEANISVQIVDSPELQGKRPKPPRNLRIVHN